MAILYATSTGSGGHNGSDLANAYSFSEAMFISAPTEPTEVRMCNSGLITLSSMLIPQTNGSAGARLNYVGYNSAGTAYQKSFIQPDGSYTDNTLVSYTSAVQYTGWSGFELQAGAGATSTYCVYNPNTSCNFSFFDDCTFDGAAIGMLSDSDYWVRRNCTFSDNTTGQDSGSSDNNACFDFGNTYTGNFTGYKSFASNQNIINCIFKSNTTGLKIRTASYIQRITNNIFHNNSNGVAFDNAATPLGMMTFRNNILTSNTNYAIRDDSVIDQPMIDLDYNVFHDNGNIHSKHLDADFNSGYMGTNNLSVDPSFVNTNSFQLSSSTTLVGTGDSGSTQGLLLQAESSGSPPSGSGATGYRSRYKP